MFPSFPEARMSSMVQTMVESASDYVESLAKDGVADKSEATPHGLVARLAGVPKGALKAVLGSKLGEMVWRHVRGRAQWPETAVADEQVVARLIRHLSHSAAVELAKAGKQAKFIRLTVWHGDGQSVGGRIRLGVLSREEDEICSAAMALFTTLEPISSTVQYLELNITAVADTAVQPCSVPAWLTTQPEAVLA